MTIEEQVAEYVELRDKKAAIAAKAKDLTSKLDKKMAELERSILSTFDQLGMESARTDAGTAYKTVTRKTSVSSWDSFLPWIQETESWHMLTRAANKTAVLEYLDTEEELPPGVSLYSEVSLNVDRPKKVKK